MNRVLLDLARAADVDLWTLDALFWGIDAARSTAQGTARTTGGRGSALNPLSDEHKAAIAMRYSIEQTVKYSNGQQELQRVKNKELRLSATELEALLERLLVEQEGKCALTGLPLQYNGDPAFKPSPDRIDSDGHYEAGNIQVVCWFANRWKGVDSNEEFARLLAAVRAVA